MTDREFGKLGAALVTADLQRKGWTVRKGKVGCDLRIDGTEGSLLVEVKTRTRKTTTLPMHWVAMTSQQKAALVEGRSKLALVVFDERPRSVDSVGKHKIVYIGRDEVERAVPSAFRVYYREPSQ